MKLDTTASMARDMRRSPWNQTVVLVIAAKASQLAATNPEYYGGDTEHSGWQKLISDRLYKIFLDVEKAKKGTRDHDHKAQKERSKRRRLRQYTHERRIQIATVMITVMENLGNEEEYICWSEILYSLDQLGVAGTSDSEDILDTQGQQGVIVYEPNFRHAWFRTLFHELDKLPETAHRLFSNVGRKRLPRICGNERVERPPPANLPSSYFQPEYLDKMKKGLTPTVVPTKVDRPLPRLPNLQVILSQVDVGSEDLLE
ncbi:hypothetical protein FB446DRAFT_220815 [Lentinula raphanica]|nr:hypothetical protein FB446DRAFT_220815 [Lentinula raphanica]